MCLVVWCMHAPNVDIIFDHLLVLWYCLLDSMISIYTMNSSSSQYPWTSNMSRTPLQCHQSMPHGAEQCSNLVSGLLSDPHRVPWITAGSHEHFFSTAKPWVTVGSSGNQPRCPDRSSRGYLFNTTDDPWGLPSESILPVPAGITASAPGIQQKTICFQEVFRRIRGYPWEFSWVVVAYSACPWAPVGVPAKTRTLGIVQDCRGFALVQVCLVGPHGKSCRTASELKIVPVGSFGLPLSWADGIR